MVFVYIVTPSPATRPVTSMNRTPSTKGWTGTIAIISTIPIRRPVWWTIHWWAKPAAAPSISSSTTKADIQETVIKSPIHTPSIPGIVMKTISPGYWPWVIHFAKPWTVAIPRAIYNSRSVYIAARIA